MTPKLIVAGEFVDDVNIAIETMGNGKIYGHISHDGKGKFTLPDGGKALLIDGKERRIVGVVENNKFIFSEV